METEDIENQTFSVDVTIANCNRMLASAGLVATVFSAEDVKIICSSTSVFVAACEALIGRKLERIRRERPTPHDRAFNNNIVIAELANKVLYTDLTHINGDRIVAGNTRDISDLLEIIAALSGVLPEGGVDTRVAALPGSVSVAAENAGANRLVGPEEQQNDLNYSGNQGKGYQLSVAPDYMNFATTQIRPKAAKATAHQTGQSTAQILSRSLQKRQHQTLQKWQTKSLPTRQPPFRLGSAPPSGRRPLPQVPCNWPRLLPARSLRRARRAKPNVHLGTKGVAGGIVASNPGDARRVVRECGVHADGRQDISPQPCCNKAVARRLPASAPFHELAWLAKWRASPERLIKRSKDIYSLSSGKQPCRQSVSAFLQRWPGSYGVIRTHSVHSDAEESGDGSEPRKAKFNMSRASEVKPKLDKMLMLKLESLKSMRRSTASAAAAQRILSNERDARSQAKAQREIAARSRRLERRLDAQRAAHQRLLAERGAHHTARVERLRSKKFRDKIEGEDRSRRLTRMQREGELFKSLFLEAVDDERQRLLLARQLDRDRVEALNRAGGASVVKRMRKLEEELRVAMEMESFERSQRRHAELSQINALRRLEREARDRLTEDRDALVNRLRHEDESAYHRRMDPTRIAPELLRRLRTMVS